MLRTAYATLCNLGAELDAKIRKQANQHRAEKRLITKLRDGPVVVFNFIVLVDDPGWFRTTSNMGALLGLTPRRH